MGVFVSPPKTGEAAASYDPNPEKNEKNKISEIENWINTRGLPFEQTFTNATYSGWFVKVAFIDIDYFNNALKNLKKRKVAGHYTEKGGYVWVHADKFVGIAKPIKWTVTTIKADFPKKNINIYYVFVNSMRTTKAQDHLNKITADAKKEFEEKKAQGVEAAMQDGTYVIKNKIKGTTLGTGGGGTPIKLLYNLNEDKAVVTRIIGLPNDRLCTKKRW